MNTKQIFTIEENLQKQQIIIKGEQKDLEKLIHLFLEPGAKKLQSQKQYDNTNIKMGLGAHETLRRYQGNLVYEPRMSSPNARKVHYPILLNYVKHQIKKYEQLITNQ